MKRIIAGIFVFSLVALTFATQGCNKKTVQPEAVYLIDAFVGDVQISHNGTDWIPAQVGMELKQNDAVKTGANSFCDIVMPNRGIFRVTYGTVVYIKQLTEKIETLQVRQGRIAVNVTEKLHDDEDFRVETGTAVVAVRGTQFVIDIKGTGEFRATVREGVVTATPNVNLDKLHNNAVRTAVQSSLEVEVAPDQAIDLSAAQTSQMQTAIDAQISDSTEPSAVDGIVQTAYQQAAVEVKPADDTATDPSLNDIMGSQAASRIQNRVQDYQESVQALNEAVQSVGGNMATNIVGDRPSTREEDEATLSGQVSNVNSRVGNTGLAESVVGDRPTTREEDESTLDDATANVQSHVGTSRATTTTVANQSEEDTVDSAANSAMDRLRARRSQ